MSISISLAKAHTRDPISKMTMPTHKVYLRPKAIEILPYSGAKHATGSMKADVNQPTLEKEPNSSLTTVNIVETMVWSKATMNIAITTLI
ncbi:hypothetical protein OXX69_013704, partial [Metschnikowia pulcherrima]